MTRKLSEDPSSNQLLVEAIKVNDVERVAELIHRGANVDAKTRSGLPLFCYAKTDAIVTLLSQSGANINMQDSDGATCLHFAALGNADQVAMLLRHGASTDIVTTDGETPLFWAITADKADIVELLIRNGAYLDAQRADGWTPLHKAVVGGHDTIVEQLLRLGAKPSICDEQGETALMVAAYMDDAWDNNAVRHLIAYGAEVNYARPSDGFRPIHCAAFHGNRKLVDELIIAGADVNAKTLEGSTPADIARSCGHTSTEERLVKKSRRQKDHDP